MPFKIVRNDLTRMETDVIVNTANPLPTYGSGTDLAVYKAAGEEKLLAARKKIGRLETGQAVITPGYELKAGWIIHTVGPVWQGGGFGEEKKLAECYRNSLRLAKRRRCRSIAFPLISAGSYGFPREKALRIALDCFEEFLQKDDMEIYLVVFGAKEVLLSKQLTDSIDSFIDDRYVREKSEIEYGRERGSRNGCTVSVERRRQEAFTNLPKEDFSEYEGTAGYEGFGNRQSCDMPLGQAPAPGKSTEPKVSSGKGLSGFPFLSPKKKSRSLDELIGLQTETFQQMLLRLIREKGMKNAEVYKKAGLDKRLFAKIKANEEYAPKKSTAILLAMALKLSMDETLDLIGRAGYAFSPCSKQDLVVQYFIENGKYDLFELEVVLFEYGLEPLGNYS